MDQETRENFDRIYALLTRIEVNCSNVTTRFDGMSMWRQYMVII